MNEAQAIKWFTEQKRRLLREVRAFDDFSVASDAIQRTQHGFGQADDPLGQLSGSLFMTAVIFYARPFLNYKNTSGKSERYSEKPLRDHPDFDNSLHSHLLDLRHKVIAHSDAEQMKPALHLFMLEIAGQSTSSERVSIPAAGTLVSYSLRSISGDHALGKIVRHIQACIDVAQSNMKRGMAEYLANAEKYPAYAERVREKGTPDFPKRSFVLEPYKPGYNLNMQELTNELVRLPSGNLYRAEYIYRSTAFTVLKQDHIVSVDGKEIPIHFRQGRDFLNVPDKVARTPLKKWWRSFVAWWKQPFIDASPGES